MRQYWWLRQEERPDLNENLKTYVGDQDGVRAIYVDDVGDYSHKHQQLTNTGEPPGKWEAAWIVIRRPILSTDALLKLESRNAVLNTHEKQRKMKPPTAIVQSSCST